MTTNADLLNDFMAEAGELIENARIELTRLETLPEDQRLDSLNAVFRTFHSLKGGSGVFEYKNAMQIAHRTENLLDQWRKNPALYSPKGGRQIGKVLDRLEHLIHNGDTMSATDHDPMDTSTPTTIPTLATAAPVAPPTPVAKKEYLRISAESVQKTLDTITELFMIRNQMRYLVEQHTHHLPQDFNHAWDMLDNSMRRTIGELETVSMSMRMVTLDNLFARLEKTVATYLDSSDKKIRVEKMGGETELDKKVLDALSDSLLHMIRNSMDHGIESVAARKAAGKPEEGTIRLSADVSGNEVIITISDDGKGMSAPAILEAARSKGIDTSHIKDPQAAVELIFLPGFSTAKEITSTSGRGVGMDVVKSSVERLNGTVHIATEVGKGTQFEIRLPLSLSVISVLIAQINGQSFALSTKDIVETLRVSPEMLSKNGAEQFLQLRDTLLPCYSLNQWIGNTKRAEMRYRREFPVCIVRDGSKRYALVLDRLDTNTELVVKPAPNAGPQFHYLTGVAVLPTGRPIFVLSLSKLVRDRTQNTQEGNELVRSAA